MERKTAFLAAALAIVTISTVGWASVTTWTGTSADWVSGNWDAGAPTPAQDTRITNGGTVTISAGDAAAAGSLNLGLDTNSDNVGNGINVGNLVMNGGTFAVGTTGNFIIGEGNHLFNGIGTFTLNAGTVDTTHTNIRLGAFGGTGTITQNGGILGSEDFTWNISPFDSDATAYYIGQEGGTGTYNLTAGTLNSPWTSLGYGGQGYWCGTGGYRNAPLTLNGTAPGWGYFNQSGGTHNTGELTVGGGWDSGGFGIYTMTAGALNATNIELGELDGNGTGNQTVTNPTLGVNSQIWPSGTFNQSGGVVTVTTSLVIGSDLCNFGGYGGQGTGTYNFYGGTLTDTITAVNAGIFGIGAGTSMHANLTVRNGAGATGTFQGNGVVNFSGTLTNNGRVIADGGLLDLSSFAAVTSTVLNVAANGATTNGWFAVNGGQLKLPTINVVGGGAYNWGEAQGTATPTLVNSMKVTVNGFSGAGGLGVSLFDPANGGAQSTSALGAGVSSLWDVTASFGYSNLNVAVRYNDANLPNNAQESNLKLFTYTGGNWVLVGNVPDTANKLLSATGQQAGWYAVADPAEHWTAGNSTWTTAGNWNYNFAPDVDAWVDNGGTANISTAVSVYRFFVGNAGGLTGSIVMNGGSLSVSGPAAYIGYGYVGGGAGGTGTFTLNSGTLSMGNGSQLEVGCARGGSTGTLNQNGGLVQSLDPNWATAGVNANEAFYIGAYSTGTYNLSAGTLNSPWTSVGYGGNPSWAGSAPGIGYFVQTGGIHNTPLLTVGTGWDNGGTGTYTISAGALNATNVELGMTDGGGTVITPPNGTFNQNGGTVTITQSLVIGADAGNYGGTGGRGVGTYNLYGGTLTDGGNGANLIVRLDAPATGTFQGRGAVNFTGTLTNNGQVIADGGTLDLSTFSAVTSAIANATTDGWFAKNGGKLVLPPVVATSAAPTVNWGENSALATPTLVNSARVTVHGLIGSASFNISLDDTANSELPGSHGAINSVGIWNVGVTPSGSFTSYDLGLRYDDVAAGPAENYLGVYDYTGGNWIKLDSTLDTADHVITAYGLQASTFVVVGTSMAGDTNIDGVTNASDIDAIFAHFGAPAWSQWKVDGDGTAVGQGDVTYELHTIFHTNYGDWNLDGKTDFVDFQILLDHWQAPGGWAQGDGNGDGKVDFLDFQKLLDYWNPGGWKFSSAQAPEPASLSLLLLGGLALLRRKK